MPEKYEREYKNRNHYLTSLCSRDPKIKSQADRVWRRWMDAWTKDPVNTPRPYPVPDDDEEDFNISQVYQSSLDADRKELEEKEKRDKNNLNNIIQNNLGEYQKPSSYLNPEDPFSTGGKYQQKPPEGMSAAFSFWDGFWKKKHAIDLSAKKQDFGNVPITNILKTQPFANDGSINMPRTKADYGKDLQTVPINICRFGENPYQGKDLGNDIRDFHSKHENGTVKNTVGELIEQNKGIHAEIPLNGYMMDFDTGRYDYGNVQAELQNARLKTTPYDWNIFGELKIRPDVYNFGGVLSKENESLRRYQPITRFDGTLPVNISGSHFSNNIGTGTPECKEKTRQDEIYGRTEHPKIQRSTEEDILRALAFAAKPYSKEFSNWLLKDESLRNIKIPAWLKKLF